MIYVFCAFLVFVIVVLAWFCVKLTRKLLFISSNITELDVRLEEFDTHINFIYELEMFYGDETIKNLIRHSKDLRNFMKAYRDVIDMTEEIEEENADNSDPDSEDDEAQDDSSEEKDIVPGKTIFHNGA